MCEVAAEPAPQVFQGSLVGDEHACGAGSIGDPEAALGLVEVFLCPDRRVLPGVLRLPIGGVPDDDGLPVNQGPQRGQGQIVAPPAESQRPEPPRARICERLELLQVGFRIGEHVFDSIDASSSLQGENT